MNYQKPRDERMLLGCSSVVFIPLSAFILNEAVKAGKPNDPITSVVVSLLKGVSFASLLFFTAGFLWATTGADLVKRIVDFFAMKFAWTIIPFLVLIAVLTTIAAVNR